MRSTLLPIAAAAAIAGAAAAGRPDGLQIDDAGTLYLPGGERIPYSDLASEAARWDYIETVRGYEAVLAAAGSGRRIRSYPPRLSAGGAARRDRRGQHLDRRTGA